MRVSLSDDWRSSDASKWDLNAVSQLCCSSLERAGLGDQRSWRRAYAFTVMVDLAGTPSLEMAMDAINLGAFLRLLIKPFDPMLLSLAIRGEVECLETARLL